MPDNEFQTLMTRMDDGFTKVFVKLDTFRDEFIFHKDACSRRFTGIELDQAVRSAILKKDNDAAAEKLDWGKWLVRGTLGTIAFGWALLMWMIFIGNAKIIIQ